MPSPRIRNKGIRLVRVADIEDNPLNFRTHPEAQRAAFAGIETELGFYGYPDVYETEAGTIRLIDGQLRKEHLLSKYGPEATIEVNMTDFDEDEAKKALLTHDPLSAMAEADKVLLDQLLREVGTGDEALQKMMTDLADEAGLYQDDSDATEIEEDEVPEPPVDPITKPGNLWILGEHRLLCGDSTKAEDVERLMAGAKADLCFTSPPYGQQRDYTKESNCSDWDKLMNGVFANLPMSDAGQVLVNLGLIHSEGEWLPYWDKWIEWMREQGWRRFGFYVWDQMHGLRGDWAGRFAPSHEFIFHFNKVALKPCKWVASLHAGERGGALRNKNGTFNEVTTDEIQSHKLPDSVWRIQRQKGGIDGHPAPFSVALVVHALNSWPGIAYEPFLGSGTTLIAAEQLGRKCYGMEISPQYCDVIVKRWENLTGKKAVLEGSK